METRGHRVALVLVVAVLTGACSMPGLGAASSPAPTAASASPASSTPGSPSPAPVTGAFGVLVSPLSGANYTVSLVGIDGRVVASAPATTPAAVTCANGAAGVVPIPVSTSNSRVYFMDAQGVIRYIAPNGDAGRATTVPIGSARRSSFAVSPDDQRIAVVVMDYTANGAATRLYVEDLNGGGHHLDTFADSGAYTLWATGWHGTNNLVVAKVAACDTHVPGCCGPEEFHVVDPGTAVRRFTVGGPTCRIAGAPSPAGVMCSTDLKANVLTWTGATARSFATQGFAAAYLSPSGSQVATTPSADTVIQESGQKFVVMQVCGWIDDTHIFSGGDSQRQPRVGDVTTGKVVPIPAQGDCSGRIPGGL